MTTMATVTYELRDEGTGRLEYLWTIRRGHKVVRRSKRPGGHAILSVEIGELARRTAVREGVTVRVFVQGPHDRADDREYTVTPEQAREHEAAIRAICERAIGRSNVVA